MPSFHVEIHSGWPETTAHLRERGRNRASRFSIKNAPAPAAPRAWISHGNDGIYADTCRIYSGQRMGGGPAGRAQSICVGNRLFTFASILCGMSNGLWQFHGGEVPAGDGGAMMVPVGRLVVLRITEKKDSHALDRLHYMAGLAAPVIGPRSAGSLRRIHPGAGFSI